MRHLSLAIFLSLMGACVEAPVEVVFARHAKDAPLLHYQVFIDPSFPPSIIPVIQDAVYDWQVSLRSLIEFKVAIERSDCAMGEYMICINMVQSGEIRSGEAGDTFYYGYPEHSLIRISTDNFNPDVANWRECTRITTTHEMGHAMGLSHQSGTIMSPNGDHVSHFITQRDVQQFFQVHGIK